MKTIMKRIALALVMMSVATQMSATRFSSHAPAPVTKATKAAYQAAKNFQHSAGNTVIEQTTEEMIQSYVDSFKSSVATLWSYVPSKEDVMTYLPSKETLTSYKDTAVSYVPSTDEVVEFVSEHQKEVAAATVATAALLYVGYKKYTSKKS